MRKEQEILSRQEQKEQAYKKLTDTTSSKIPSIFFNLVTALRFNAFFLGLSSVVYVALLTLLKYSVTKSELRRTSIQSWPSWIVITKLYPVTLLALKLPIPKHTPLIQNIHVIKTQCSYL